MADSSIRDQIDSPNWHIIGAGAMGCLWAAMLAETKVATTLVLRGSMPMEIETTDLRYSGPERCTSYKVYSATLNALQNERRQISNLLVATKSYDVAMAIENALPLLQPRAKILTLCNGYGLHQAIARKIQRVNKQLEFYAAATSEGALLQRSMQVQHTGRGVTKIGRIGGVTRAGLLPGQLPLNIEYVDHIEVSLLQKYFINCAINPLTALHDCPNGALLDDKRLYRKFRQLCDELQSIYQVAITELCDGSGIPDPGIFDVLDSASAVARATAANLSSMLRDYSNGRQLELQYLNCEAIAMAKRFGLACSINEQIVEQF